MLWKFQSGLVPFQTNSEKGRTKETKIQTIKMKTFQIVERNCALMGITAYQAAQKLPFNARNSLVLFILCITLFSNLMRLIRETNNFKDYTISIFSACTMTVSILIFAILLARLRYLFYFQHRTEEIINQSKSKVFENGSFETPTYPI